ncbi:MAG: hypothetical protein N2490_01840 [Ignavibacteria bacterium]|nr:hypothetical protein [Ignavibacteria bacterium]
MAKVIKKTKKKKDYINLNLNIYNLAIIGLGILVIIIGYIFLSENSVDGFFPTVLAPILLVLGYCVIIPVGIIISIKKKDTTIKTIDVPVEDKKEDITTGTSSNIQTY